MKIKQILSQAFSKLLFNKLICILLVSPFFAIGQEPSDFSWWNKIHNWDGFRSWKEYYRLSPAYFGPNALPVAPVYGGILEKSSLGIAADVYFGHGDNTQDIYIHWYQSFYNSRIGVKIDIVPFEHYKTTFDVRDERASRDWDAKGMAIGDLALNFYFQLVRDKQQFPDMVLSFYSKTASGGNFLGARYYDTPAYGFNLNIGRTYTYSGSLISSLNIATDIGFLSWQLADKEQYQNDAFSYGFKFELSARQWKLDNQLAGYTGYLHNGDSPLVWRCKLKYDLDKFSYYLQYQHGIHDYPFEQVRLGFLYNLPSIY